MLELIVRRLLQAIPLLFGASIIVFLMLRLIPGDPAEVYAGPQASPEVIKAVRIKFGLDKPLPVQYVIWLSRAVQGDLGESYLSRAPVLKLLGERFPATLELTFSAMFISLVIGVPAGIIAALKAGKAVDWAVTSASAIAMAVPSYWSGIVVIYFFAQSLGWLPPGGRPAGGVISDPVHALRYLMLPALTLGLFSAATLARLMKSSIVEVLHEDYVRTARAKGLSGNQVLLNHVLRNAMVPVITVIGLQFGKLLGGAVITETVFAWPGIGRLILFALNNRDYVIVQGAMLALVLVFIVVNLLTDIAYGFIDPRIRVTSRARA